MFCATLVYDGVRAPLAPQVRECGEPFEAELLAQALGGLGTLGDDAAVQSLVKSLAVPSPEALGQVVAGITELGRS